MVDEIWGLKYSSDFFLINSSTFAVDDVRNNLAVVALKLSDKPKHKSKLNPSGHFVKLGANVLFPRIFLNIF